MEPNSTVSELSPKPRRDQDDATFFFDWDTEGRSASARSQAPSQTMGGKDRPKRRLSPKTVPRDLPKPSKFTQQDAWSSIRWEQRSLPPASEFAKSRERHTLPKVDVPNYLPNIPPGEILSPQPKQSVQKILRLTGMISPTTILSADAPTLHNSSQKIKQLTGHDFAPPRPWTDDEADLVEVEDGMSNVSTAETASVCSNESLDGDALSIGHAESTFSSSYVESVDDVFTQLTAPKHSAPPARFRDSRSYSEPLVRDALRLSGFIATDSLARVPSSNKRAQGKRESWYRDCESDRESTSTSSSEHSDVTELEETVDKLRLQMTLSFIGNGTENIFRNSTTFGETLVSKLPNPPHRDLPESHVPDDMAFAGQRSDFVTRPSQATEQAMDRFQSATLPPPSPTSFYMDGSRRQGSLSERRLTNSDRGSSPLSLRLPISSDLPPPPPPPPKSARRMFPRASDSSEASVRDADIGSAQSPLLTRILTNGTASGSHATNSSSNNKILNPHSPVQIRGNGGPSIPSRPGLSRMGSGSMNEPQQPTSAWSPDTPDTPESGTGTGITAFAAVAQHLVRRATDGGGVPTLSTFGSTSSTFNDSAPSISTSASTGTVVTATPPISAAVDRGKSSVTPLHSEPGRGKWKKALDHAKSKAGMKSKADRKKK